MVHGQEHRSHKAGRRVLVVEDNVDSAESLAMLLRMGHHEVMVTHDGATALNTLETFAADLILLDIGLPGMDGYMVAQSVRSRFPTRSIHIIAMTGYGREEDRQLAREAGFDEHLTKPVDPEHLLRLITAQARSERRAH
jgi:CheY-like chemotaxis protein